MKNYLTFRFILLAEVIFINQSLFAQTPFYCPSNIDFEHGDFSYYKYGLVKFQVIH